MQFLKDRHLGAMITSFENPSLDESLLSAFRPVNQSEPVFRVRMFKTAQSEFN